MKTNSNNSSRLLNIPWLLISVTIILAVAGVYLINRSSNRSDEKIPEQVLSQTSQKPNYSAEVVVSEFYKECLNQGIELNSSLEFKEDISDIAIFIGYYLSDEDKSFTLENIIFKINKLESPELIRVFLKSLNNQSSSDIPDSVFISEIKSLISQRLNKLESEEETFKEDPSKKEYSDPYQNIPGGFVPE